MKHPRSALVAFTLTISLALLASCGPSNPTPSQGGPGPSGQGQGQGQPGQGQPGGGQTGGQAGAGGGGGRPQGAGGPGGAPGAGQGRQTTVTVQVESARFGTLTVNNTTAGVVVAATQSSVAAGASGTVKTLLRQVGDWVETGTPVIQLDDAQLRLSLRLAQTTLENAKINAGVADSSGGTSKLNLQLQSAQSALASAQKNYASAQALAKVGGISGSDLDNALTQLQNAQANLEAAKMSVQQNNLQVETATIQLQQAQLNLANATIKAPYSGQISAINLHPGEYVGTSTAAFSLVSRDKVISFGVSPADAPGLGLGTPVTFAYAGKSVTTKITQVPSAPVNGLVPLTADLPGSLAAPLGTVGTLTYQLALAQGVLVPLAALQSAENKTFVYYDDQGKARRSEVTVLAESGTFAAVSGLAPNTSVVVNPPPGLLIGGPIQAVGSPGSSPAPGAAQGGAGSGRANGQRPETTEGRPRAEGAPAAGAETGTGRPRGERARGTDQNQGAASGAPAGSGGR